LELESGSLPDGQVEAGLGVDVAVDLHAVLLELGADDVEVVVEFREHLSASRLDVWVLVDHRQDGLEFDKHFDELHRVFSIDVLLDSKGRCGIESDRECGDWLLDSVEVRLDFLNLASIARSNDRLLNHGDLALAFLQRHLWFRDW